MEYLLYLGVVMAVLGLIGLGFCIKMAAGLKKAEANGEDTKDRMGTLIALNTASLGIAFIGLALVGVGMIVA